MCTTIDSALRRLNAQNQMPCKSPLRRKQIEFDAITAGMTKV
ncbi:MAG: hypothetical protein ACLUB2_10505 [Butyricicoccus pullicaecorum]